MIEDEIETLRLEENEGSSTWTLYLDGERLAFALRLEATVVERLEDELVGFRMWRADRLVSNSAYTRHVAAGLCPVWVVAEYDGGEDSGPCCLDIEHDGEHRLSPAIDELREIA